MPYRYDPTYTALALNGYDAVIIVDYLYKDWLIDEQYARLFPEFNQLGKPPYSCAQCLRFARTDAIVASLQHTRWKCI